MRRNQWSSNWKIVAALALVVVGVAAATLLNTEQADAQHAVQISAGYEHTCAVTSSGALECWGWNWSGQTDTPTGRFSQVSAGGNHACAVTSSGAVQCWGYNYSGQADAPAGRFSQVSAGSGHTCAVASSGAVQCWGNNGWGRTDAPAGRFSQVSAGGSHTCAVTSSGAVQCWGNNGWGQTDAPSGRFSQVSAGDYHTCGVTSSGAVQCWGNNGWGQTDAPSGRFSQVSAGRYHTCGVTSSGEVQCWGKHDKWQTDVPSGRFSQISASDDHTCAVTSSGAVQCWGYNVWGQTDVPSGRFSQVSASRDHTCALTSSGAVQCWGYNVWGQTDAPLGRFSQVSTGVFHTCAVTSSGAVQCWGSNDYGQTNAPAGRFSQVSAGGSHTCAVTSSGAVQCWGSNDYGQTNAPAGRFSQVSAGGSHTCAVTSSGTVQCWGYNVWGQTDATSGRFSQVSAGGSHTCAVTSSGAVQCWGYDYPGLTDAPSGRFSQVSAGGTHTCAVTSNGVVQCWGNNGWGQTDAPLGRFSQVSTGVFHTCAVTSSGAVQCWGADLLYGSSFANEGSAPSEPTIEDSQSDDQNATAIDDSQSDEQPATDRLKLSVQPEEDAGAIEQTPEYRNAPVIGDGDVSTEQALHARLKARPEIGWRFSHWSGDHEGTHPEALVRLQGQQQITAHFVETTTTEPETLTARIGARALNDGSIDLVLVLNNGRELRPRRNPLSATPPTGRWLSTSEVQVNGQTLGRIQAGRLEDGRTVLRFVTPDGVVLAPEQRVLPRHSQLPRFGRLVRSSEIKIPITGCRFSEPVDDGFVLGQRYVSVDDSDAVYRVSSRSVGDGRVRYQVCGDAIPTALQYDRALFTAGYYYSTAPNALGEYDVVVEGYRAAEIGNKAYLDHGEAVKWTERFTLASQVAAVVFAAYSVHSVSNADIYTTAEAVDHGIDGVVDLTEQGLDVYDELTESLAERRQDFVKDQALRMVRDALDTGEEWRRQVDRKRNSHETLNFADARRQQSLEATIAQGIAGYELDVVLKQTEVDLWKKATTKIPIAGWAFRAAYALDDVLSDDQEEVRESLNRVHAWLEQYRPYQRMTSLLRNASQLVADRHEQLNKRLGIHPEAPLVLEP